MCKNCFCPKGYHKKKGCTGIQYYTDTFWGVSTQFEGREYDKCGCKKYERRKGLLEKMKLLWKKMVEWNPL